MPHLERSGSPDRCYKNQLVRENFCGSRNREPILPLFMSTIIRFIDTEKE